MYYLACAPSIVNGSKLVVSRILNPEPFQPSTLETPNPINTKHKPLETLNRWHPIPVNPKLFKPKPQNDPVASSTRSQRRSSRTTKSSEASLPATRTTSVERVTSVQLPELFFEMSFEPCSFSKMNYTKQHLDKNLSSRAAKLPEASSMQPLALTLGRFRADVGTVEKACS